jgi:hypothetical protein
MTPAERAQRHADDARSRIDSAIARDWWTVRTPDGREFEVFMRPAATQAEMLARYPGCGVLPR